MADNFNLRTFLSENKLTNNSKLINEVSEYGYSELMDAVDAYCDQDSPQFSKLQTAVDDAYEAGEIDTSEFGDDPSAAYRAVDLIATESGLFDEPDRDMGFDERDDRTEEGVDEYNSYDDEPHYDDVPKSRSSKDWDSDEAEDIEEITIKENKMTTREKRLVEMVQRALEEDNVDYTMGRQDDPNQLSNPAPELNIPEVANDEMVEEKPLPTYESVEDLMKEIEHGTHKAMYEYKISEMKRIAKQLEEKVTTLEESELSAHINPADVKKMKKDILTLHKGVAKIEKEYDRKFNKKTKTSEPKAEKQEVALAEGFDLRKFLVENKLTKASQTENLEEWSPYGSMAFSGNDKPKQREPKQGEVKLSTLNKGDVFKTADGSPLEFRVWGHNPTGGVDVQYTDYKFPRPNYTMRDDVMVIKLDGESS